MTLTDKQILIDKANSELSALTAELNKFRILIDKANSELSALTAELKKFPRRENGLIPDNVKTSPEYQTLKSKTAAKFEQLRRLNGSLSQHELKQLRDQRRHGRLTPKEKFL